MKVFLGGTCNESIWRDDLVEKLKCDYFNPVVDDWTENCMIEERIQRTQCDYVLYVITPKMTGVYSIAEVVEDSIKQPSKTLFCILDEDNGEMFDYGQMKSLRSVGDMVVRNGGKMFISLHSVSKYLNELDANH